VLGLVLRRLTGAVISLLVLSVVLFAMLQALPGDPATSMLGQRATPQLVRQVKHDFGLDKPVPEQYVHWLGDAVRGNLGYSLAGTGTGSGVSGTTVTSIIGQGLKVTIPLAVFGMIFAVLIGVPLGVLAAMHRGRPADGALSAVSVLGISLPDFFIAFLLILLFSSTLHWLPSVGYTDLFSDPVNGIKTLALPILSVGLINAAAVARMTRASVLEASSQEFVLLVRARGAPESVVVLKHELRNALIPILTVIGLQLGYLLGGVVVIEQVFGLPGIGRQLLIAVGQRDYPTIQGLVLTLAAAFLLVNLLVDLLYVRLDPSIRGAQ
jgi:peptide/nickel transport system permease protein